MNLITTSLGNLPLRQRMFVWELWRPFSPPAPFQEIGNGRSFFSVRRGRTRSRSLGRMPPPRRRSAPFGRSALPLLRVAGRCESAVQGDKVAFAVRFGVIFYESSVRIALDSCSLFLADTQTRTLAPGKSACLLCRTEWA